MAQFYDQDNPRASYNRSNVTSDASRYERNVSRGNHSNIERYEQQAENLVRKSTMSPAQKERARVVKAQQRRKQRQKRMAAFALACMITGGVAVGFVSNVIDTMHNNAIVYEQTSAFTKEVIYPNTHRTDNKQYYYYDYDDIADAIMADGKDFSTELYKAYSYLGEYQTDRVMRYTDYDSVAAYVDACGFKDIDAWAKSERKKIVLQSEMAEKSDELGAMHRELNGQQIMDAVEENGMGGKQ